MAAFRIFNIGAANRRVEELETQNAALTKELGELKAALESNGGEVSAQAEQLSAALAAEKETSAGLAASLNKAKETLEANTTEIAALKAELAGKDGEVETKVSRKLAEAQAALGQPSPPVAPTDAPTAAAPSGFARACSAFKKQIEKSA
jgi:ABC-type transporter Mla subunit MlaD